VLFLFLSLPVYDNVAVLISFVVGKTRAVYYIRLHLVLIRFL